MKLRVAPNMSLKNMSLKYSNTLQFYCLSWEVISYILEESKPDILWSKPPDRVLTELPAMGFKKF